MDIIKNITESILRINSNAIFSVSIEENQTVDNCTITWHEGTQEISRADIKTEMVEVQSEYDALEYQRKRKAEYPSIAYQLDDLYHNGIDGWKATIKITKDKWSKP